MNSIAQSISSASSSQEKAQSRYRKISLTAGLLYILTFISIPTLSLYKEIHQQGIVSPPVQTKNVLIGAELEIIVALSGIATAVVLFPVLKRQSETLAVGLIASRILEASTIFAGVSFMLAATTLTDQNVAKSFVALYDKMFLIGQGLIPAINDLLLGYLLYKSRLVPRTLSMIGILGAFPLIIGHLMILTGAFGMQSVPAALAAVMVAVFEFSLGIYLIVKGFNTTTLNVAKAEEPQF